MTTITTETTAANPAPPTTTAPAMAAAAGPGDAPEAPQSDSSGFYRLQDQTLQFAPNVVHAPGYTLTREGRAQLDLPRDGWAWFDSREAAYAHHNLPIPKPEPQGRHRRPDPRSGATNRG
ncbi:MAG: hypothetical protein ACKO0M_02045 [Cyanobium sp.]